MVIKRQGRVILDVPVYHYSRPGYIYSYSRSYQFYTSEPPKINKYIFKCQVRLYGEIIKNGNIYYRRKPLRFPVLEYAKSPVNLLGITNDEKNQILASIKKLICKQLLVKKLHCIGIDTLDVECYE